MTLINRLLLAVALVVTARLVAADTASFQRQLQTDLRREVERLHHTYAADRAKNQKPSDFYAGYLPRCSRGRRKTCCGSFAPRATRTANPRRSSAAGFGSSRRSATRISI